MHNKQIYAKYATFWKICKFVENVQFKKKKKCSIRAKCAKLWKMCKYVQNLKKKSAKLCINVLDVPNCARCAKFGKMFIIVQT